METERRLDRSEASALLRRVADALDTDHDQALEFDDVNFRFGEDLEIEAEYEQSDDKVEFDIEFQWKPERRSARQPVYTVFKGSQGQWYFNLKAPNGEIILASEAYRARGGALNGIESVKQHAEPYFFQKLESMTGQPYFVLTAANGQVIGVSQMYKRAQSRDRGIAAVMEYANRGEIREQQVGNNR